MSKIFDVVVIGFCLLGFYVWADSKLDADVAEVQAIYEAAEKTPETKKMMVDLLLAHPVPTNGQLSSVKKEINSALVLSEAKKITQNGSLKHESVNELEPEKKSEFSDLNNRVFTGAFGLIVLLVVFQVWKKWFRDI